MAFHGGSIQRVGVEIVVLECCPSEVYVAVSGHGRTRTSGDVEHATESVAVFRREASGHQVNGLENLRADARSELGLSVVQERYAIDELVQREFGATHSEEVVVAVARARHQVVDKIVGSVRERIGKQVQILLGKGVGTAGLLGIDGEIAGLHLDLFLNRCPGLQIEGQRERLTRAQNEIEAGGKKAVSFGLESVRPGIDGGKTKAAGGVAGRLLRDAACGALQ